MPLQALSKIGRLRPLSMHIHHHYLRVCAALLCAFALPVIAHAQDVIGGYVAMAERDNAARARAEGDCAGRPVGDSFRMKTTYGITAYQNTHTAPEWSGGCIRGLRDGHGRLRTHSVITSSNSTAVPLIFVSDGEMVAGQRAGRWCQWQGKTTVLMEGGKAKSVATPPDTTKPPDACQMYFSGMRYLGAYFTRDGDSPWRIGATARIGLEAMERASQQLIAAARTGQAPPPLRLPVEIDALTDLVAGGKAWFAPPSLELAYSALQGRAPPLAGKRVALVLSTRATTELQRWRDERQALLDATAQVREEDIQSSRDSFIKDSAPEALVRNWSATLAMNGAQVFVAQDLSPLADGRVDYALVVDWSYHSRLPRNVRDLRRLDLCLNEQARKNKTPACMEKALLRIDSAVWLIDPDLGIHASYSQEHISHEDVWLETSKDYTMKKVLSSASTALRWGMGYEVL